MSQGPSTSTIFSYERLWLVDFDNGSGDDSRRYTEARLEYFHSYEEGFRGRLRTL